MIYVFIPYYNEDTPGFTNSLTSQTVRHIRIKRNRKRDKIYWTKAVRDFQREAKRCLGAKDDDIVIIMNNDIEFGPRLFEEIKRAVIPGVIYFTEGVIIDWKKKQFKVAAGYFTNYDSFYGHCFAMTLGDFKRFKFSRLLPHALADIDFGIKVLKKLEPYHNWEDFNHPEHSYERCNLFSFRNYKNPIIWTIFLLKHPNRHTPLNILKTWYDGLFS